MKQHHIIFLSFCLLNYMMLLSAAELYDAFVFLSFCMERIIIHIFATSLLDLHIYIPCVR